MRTADDLLARLKKEPIEIEGIDTWIDEYLFERFSRASSNTVEILASRICDLSWDRNLFTSSLERRGFIVSYYCEDRPCGSCWYTITIPWK